jgi:hypothetical protein
MNTLSRTIATVKPLRFAVGTPIPFIYGAQDAASGLACVPEMIFVQRADQVNYAAGYASVSGPTLTTQQFLEVK